VLVDSVFAVPGTLGRSPVAQIGQQEAYTAHVLYAFRIPIRTFETNSGVVDTLFADELDLVLRGDSVVTSPFTGTMRIGLVEVAPGAPRNWARAGFIDSVLTGLPAVEPDELAADTLVSGAALVGDRVQLDFDLVRARIAGYDSVRASGDSLDINVAVRFEGFTAPGRGFLELPLQNSSLVAQLIVFSVDRTVAVQTATPVRSRPVVEFDPMYDPGTKVVVSDGFRLHTFLKFAPLRRVLPESALVFSAELVLTQVDTLDGFAFGTGPNLGVVVPSDTTQIFSDSTALRPIAFATPLTAIANTTVSIPVTPYIFDIQEGDVRDRGMILRVSNEGTKARHFEFYGSAAVDSLVRPRLRIVYGFPAEFEGAR